MIRKVEKDDREVYINLAKQFYTSSAVSHPISDDKIEATFEEMLRSDIYCEGFLIVVNDEIAGYSLVAKTFSQEAGGNVLWVEELFIKEKFRGKGLGSQMLEYLFKNRPAARYRLEVMPENKRAAALYSHLGFEVLPYAQMVKDKK